MYKTISDGRAYVRLYASLFTNQGTQPSTYDPNAYLAYSADRLFFQDISTDAPGIFSGHMACADVVGVPYNTFEKPYPVSFLTERPSNEPYVGKEDYERYYLPGSTFFSGFPDPGFTTREKQVEHCRYNGDIEDEGSGLSPYFLPSSDRVTFHGITSWPRFNFSIAHARQLARTGVDAAGRGIFESRVPGGGFVPTYDIYDHLESVVSDIQRLGELSYSPGSAWTLHYTDAVNNSRVSDFGNHHHVDVEYSYEIKWHETAGVSRAKFRVHFVFDVSFQPFYGFNSVTNWNDISFGVVDLQNYSTVELVSSSFPFVPTGYADCSVPPSAHVSAVSQSHTIFQDSLFGVPNFVTYRFYDKTYLNRRHRLFQAGVQNIFGDLRPSSFLSAANALETYTEALSANHVQTLSQLSGIMGLLPDLAEIPSLYTKISHGDFSAISDLLDYITDAILRYRFAQAPNARNLEEILGSDINGFLKRLGSTDHATIYGKFLWTFPDQDNFLQDGRLVLESRSKLRISSDVSTLVGAVLTANSVGLLPTLSRIWETLPFTFVIDWFTAMNKRLKLVDDQILYTIFRTDWCVNSYKVCYYPSDLELLRFNLKHSDPAHQFNISVYRREVSVYMPRLRGSRYDFLGPSHGPNPITAGALIWQNIT